MSNPFKGADFGRIGLWVLAGCGAFALVLLNTPEWHALKPEAQAAWVQAVGSIVAIAIAIAVPWRIDKIRRDERQVQIDHEANMLAAELRKRLIGWQDRTNEMADSLSTATTADQVFRLITQQNFLEEALYDKFEKVHILGQAGKSLIAASVYWRRLNTIQELLSSNRREPATEEAQQAAIMDAQHFSRRMAMELNSAVFAIYTRLEKIAPAILR